MAWTVWGSNPGGGEFSLTRPDSLRSPPSLLCNGHRFSFLEVMRLGRDVDHYPAYSAEVKERVELYLYYSFGHSWSVTGRTLLLGTSQITVI